MGVKKFVAATVISACVAANLAVITVDVVAISTTVKTIKSLLKELKDDEPEPQSLMPVKVEESMTVYKKPKKLRKAVNIVKEILK